MGPYTRTYNISVLPTFKEEGRKKSKKSGIGRVIGPPAFSHLGGPAH